MECDIIALALIIIGDVLRDFGSCHTGALFNAKCFSTKHDHHNTSQPIFLPVFLPKRKCGGNEVKMDTIYSED